MPLPAESVGSARDEALVRPRRAATRVHRVPPEAPAHSTAVPAQPAVASPSFAGQPALDLDELGRDLWKRFEQRMRIEQERRGRR